MFWCDGGYYKGQWLKGEQEGLGHIKGTDGSIRQGRFHKNQLVREMPVDLKAIKTLEVSSSDLNSLLSFHS